MHSKLSNYGRGLNPAAAQAWHAVEVHAAGSPEDQPAASREPAGRDN